MRDSSPSKSAVTFVAFALVAVLATPAFSRDPGYTDHDSGPLRLISYVLHPIGTALEYLIARPIHVVGERLAPDVELVTTQDPRCLRARPDRRCSRGGKSD